ncbi:hypothetical protein BHE74_00012317 [Ensete ventricosum]|nr:hypothetical protein BHE74_00012317 [Ensete ventricosum]
MAPIPRPLNYPRAAPRASPCPGAGPGPRFFRTPGLGFRWGSRKGVIFITAAVSFSALDVERWCICFLKSTKCELSGFPNALKDDRGKKAFFAEAGKEKLKHGLKILVETEKQLRTSKDQSTWLTAALLQFNTGESLPPTNMNPLEAPEKVSYSRALCWKLYWCRASLPVEKAGTKRQQDEPRPRSVGWLWPCAAAAASEQASRETTTAEQHSPALKQKAKRRR